MAIIGVTAKLEYSTDEGTTYIQVPNCKSVSFPAMSVTSVETTHLGITDYAKTYIPGMTDAGNVSFEAEFTSDTYTALSSILRTEDKWQISSPSGESIVVSCDGFLMSMSTSMAGEEEVMISGEVKMTGKPEVA